MPSTSRKTRTLLATAMVCGLAIASSHASAGTLENLERERSITIQTFLDPALTPQERQSRVASENRRLVDLERMVLRDKALRGKNTRTVRRAFQDYDVTFMAHASAERNLTLIDNWLTQFGITTETVMAAQVGRR